MGIQWQPNTAPRAYTMMPMQGMPANLPAQQQPIAQSCFNNWGFMNAWRKPPMLTSFFYQPSIYPYPIYMYTLSNGHRVVIEQRPTDVISLRTFINTGSVVEDALKPSRLYGNAGFPSGIAHLDEHCHFLTTQNFPKKNSWPEFVENLGVNYNASTDHEVIQHELAFNREDLPTMLAMHAESVLRPLYKPTDISQEKTNVLNEMSMRMAPPEAKVYDKTMELMFDRPGFQTLGKREDVKGTTVEDLQRFHQTFYTPTNMVTVVSGRVDPNWVLGQIDREFGSNPPRYGVQTNNALQISLRPGEIRSATIRDPQLSYSVINLAFPAPSKANLRERIAMEFLGIMIGDGPYSLLEVEIKDKRRLATSMSVSYNPLKAAGTFEVGMETAPGQEQAALQETVNALASLPARVSQMAYYPQQFTEVRDKLIHKFKRDLNDVESSTFILGDESLTQSLPYYLNYLQLVNSITPQDLMTVAQKYFNPNTYAVVFGVPGGNANPAENAVQQKTEPASDPNPATTTGGPR